MGNFADGRTYIGQWTDGRMDGQGIMEWPSGAKYEGGFKNDMKDGEGTFYLSDNEIQYAGQWCQDKAHGHGKYKHADGSTYDGQWKMAEQNGAGVETEANGAVYQGEFLNGSKHGAGVWKSNDGEEYMGEFQYDRMHGKGSYQFKDGRLYTGQWQIGHMDGEGKMEFPNGDAFEGVYKQDLMHGKGTYIYADGSAHKSEWISGKAKATLRDEKKKEGTSRSPSKQSAGAGKEDSAKAQPKVQPDPPELEEDTIERL